MVAAEGVWAETGGFRSLADYYSPACPTPLGMFCVVAEDKQKPCCDHGPSYDRLMSHALCARLAEACVEWLQQKVYGRKRVDSARWPTTTVLPAPLR